MAFTLKDLYDATKNNYLSYELELGDEEGTVLELRNAIRLSKAERKTFAELQKDLTGKVDLPKVNQEKLEDESDEEHTARVEAELEALEKAAERIEAQRKATLHKIIKTLAGPQGADAAKAALAIFGDDLGVLVTIVGEYSEHTQVGEA